MSLKSMELRTNRSMTEVQPASSASPLDTALRFSLVAAIVLGVAGTFLYLGGWLTPHAITPARFADAFEKIDGVHSGFRRNHAKGVCVTGYFEGNGKQAWRWTSIAFQSGRVPVLGRFSLAGGNPYVADSDTAIRGLGLSFSFLNGEQWRMAMIHLPVFPVNTPQSFYDRLIASQPDPVTGKPDPKKMQAFNDAHPETVMAMRIIKKQPTPSAFANTTFNSLNAFIFAVASGEAEAVRWSMQPDLTEVAATTQANANDKDYLFEGLIADLHRKPLKWHLIVTVGVKDDPTNDATHPWPAGCEKVDVGTLTINHIESEEASPARDLNFDPLVLPSGIEPSDDPLLSARSAVYSQSVTRRSGETKQASEITPADVKK